MQTYESVDGYFGLENRYLVLRLGEVTRYKRYGSDFLYSVRDVLAPEIECLCAV